VSEAAVTIIVAGAIQVVGMIVGFLTLWVKLQYAGTKAAEAVIRAGVVEGKLDANTLATNAVSVKADTIVDQTNGTMTKMQGLVERIAERVSKLEDYNRESSHRLFDVVNTLGLKVERLLVVQEIRTPASKAIGTTEEPE
jgi:transcriptional regulator of nitric oxide reductase